nr:MAG TPA: hypothetical protein [Caudoviricetes sp.]
MTSTRYPKNESFLRTSSSSPILPYECSKSTITVTKLSCCFRPK